MCFVLFWFLCHYNQNLKFYRNVSDIFNMLQLLSRGSNYTVTNNQILKKIYPLLCSSEQHKFNKSTDCGGKKQTVTCGAATKKPVLPKLPVPDLKTTVTKYLRSAIPLLTPDEFYQTKRLACEFTKPDSIGFKLQKLLIDKAKCLDNWLETYWLHTAYLGFRLPVTVHSSPGLVFPLQTFQNRDQQVEYAAKLILATMSYKEEIDKEKIPQEFMGKDPLDMGQYKKFFGTCRIPQNDIDGLEYNSSSHIIVACNNHFFLLCVNKNQSLKHLINQLNIVIKQSETCANPVGILSSDHRDNWAESYKLLIKDPCNARSVALIQKSLFLVCLDNPLTPCQDRLTQAGLQCLHGGGSKFNGGNRWFDKTVQFIVSCDGIIGLTYEHSPSEGQPIAIMTDYIVNNMDKVGKGTESGPCVEELEFNVNNTLLCAIKQSACNLDQLVQDMDLTCNVYKKYGKNFIKQNKMSPDSYIQTAMQLAYYRLFCKPAAQYESAATRKYIGGRTETIRSCSLESVQFAKAMLDSCVSDVTKKKLMIDAINAHKKYTVDALNGLGVDRHFLGLKLIAKEKNIPIPELFSDPGFTKCTYFRLTSSQVATKCAGFMCYGAVVPDGFSFCYNPRNDDIYYATGAFNSCPTTKSCIYSEAIQKSLDDMRCVLVNTGSSDAAPAGKGKAKSKL